MNFSRLLISFALFFSILPRLHAKDYGVELIQACVSNSLKVCKLSSNSVKKEQAAKFEKAISCLKNGSSTGDSFDIGVPLPDVGQIGIGASNTATYSTEICKEEVRKLNDSQFLKEFATTFDAECGKFIAGQNQQCLLVAEKLGSKNDIQSLTCNGSQSADQVVINSRYVPGALEGPEQYAISSITGVSGLKCDENPYAGVNQYSSFSCALPKGYTDSQLVVKLKNTVSCTIGITAQPSAELAFARKSSCASLILKNLEGAPQLLKIALIGQCDICMAKNLETSSNDQRTIATRIKSCVIWSARSLAEEGMSLCVVIPNKGGLNSPGQFGNPFLEVSSAASPISGFGNPFLPASAPTPTPTPTPTPPPPVILVAPPVQSTAPDTARASSVSLAPIGTEKNVAEKWASSLCNLRPVGQILQLNGKQWENPPIDYINSLPSNDPMLLEIMKSLEGL